MSLIKLDVHRNNEEWREQNQQLGGPVRGAFGQQRHVSRLGSERSAE